jgi:hypothetical protein
LLSPSAFVFAVGICAIAAGGYYGGKYGLEKYEAWRAPAELPVPARSRRKNKQRRTKAVLAAA